MQGIQKAEEVPSGLYGEQTLQWQSVYPTAWLSEADLGASNAAVQAQQPGHQQSWYDLTRSGRPIGPYHYCGEMGHLHYYCPNKTMVEVKKWYAFQQDGKEGSGSSACSSECYTITMVVVQIAQLYRSVHKAVENRAKMDAGSINEYARNCLCDSDIVHALAGGMVPVAECGDVNTVGKILVVNKFSRLR